MFSIKFLLVALLAVLPAVTSASTIRSDYDSNCPGKWVNEDRQRELLNEFVNLIQQKQVATAYNTYVAADLIEHDPNILDGRQASIDTLTPTIQTADIQIVHKLVDGGIGCVHSKVTFPGQPFSAIADFFRFNGSCIVEHWDVMQSLPASSVNPHPLFSRTSDDNSTRAPAASSSPSTGAVGAAASSGPSGTSVTPMPFTAGAGKIAINFAAIGVAAVVVAML
jgi:predicted SnoaL-like aldol condensation-catalyzing enzyme